MSRAEIIVTAGLPDGVVFEHTVHEYPGAAQEAHQDFMKIVKERAAWLLGVSVRKDLEGNLLAIALLRIGPEPFWSNEYINSHPDSEYLQRNGIRSYDT